ncbi:MAG: M23 family metallopeptidase [Candidatus Hydrothermales bacterium]
MRKRGKGLFLKFIPEGSSKVRDIYLSPLMLKILKGFIIFIISFQFISLLFSIWMFSNFTKMKLLEYELQKAKIREKKIAEIEEKLKKFIAFSNQLENLLRPEKVLKDVSKIRDTLVHNLSKKEEFKDLTLYFEPPVKGLISNLFSPIHPGIDIVAPLGTPVKSPLEGIVIEKGIDKDFGLYLWIDHKNGMKTFYGHLKEIVVRKGEWVKKGEIIGKVGSTGKSTGPHLHFEIWNKGFPLDPLNFTNYNFFTLK